MLHQLKLNAPRLDVERPSWLLARTFDVFNRTGLLMYRSVFLDETDEWCQPVWDFVKRHEFEFIRKGVVADVSMVFRRGEWSIYVGPATGGGETSGVPTPDTVREAVAKTMRFLGQAV